MPKITDDLIAKNSSLQRGKGESQEHFLGRLTNVNLSDQKIQRIEALFSCLNIRVLYLTNNNIKHIENLRFAKYLEHLHVEDNEIETIEGLDHNQRLQKLFLDGNHISVLENIYAPLSELHLSNQVLPPSVDFTISDLTLHAFANSLTVLDISGCHLRDCKPLAVLRRLETLNCSRNLLESVEDVGIMVEGMYYLTNLDLRGNPLQKIKRVREDLMVLSDSVETLDDKAVEPKQREFLKKLKSRRRQARGKRRPAGSGGIPRNSQNSSMASKPIHPPSLTSDPRGPSRFNVASKPIAGGFRPLPNRQPSMSSLNTSMGGMNMGSSSYGSSNYGSAPGGYGYGVEASADYGGASSYNEPNSGSNIAMQQRRLTSNSRASVDNEKQITSMHQAGGGMRGNAPLKRKYSSSSLSSAGRRVMGSRQPTKTSARSTGRASYSSSTHKSPQNRDAHESLSLAPSASSAVLSARSKPENSPTNMNGIPHPIAADYNEAIERCTAVETPNARDLADTFRNETKVVVNMPVG